MNKGILGSENQYVKIDTWNYFAATYRGDGASQYKSVVATLDRLKGCTIKTTIATNDTIFTEAFSLLDGYKILTRTKTGKIASVQIKICDWLFGAIWNAEDEMLAVNRDYFKLTGGIERRLYEIARKHCGTQPYWKVGINILWKKSGSAGELKEFRRKILKGQVDLGSLPDYRVVLHQKADQVVFYSKNYRKPVQALLFANGT